MTHDEMLREYTRCYQNILSSRASQRIAELDAEAALEGLRFQMLNETQWMLPHALVAPRFTLVSVAASESESDTDEEMEAINLRAKYEREYDERF